MLRKRKNAQSIAALGAAYLELVNLENMNAILLFGDLFKMEGSDQFRDVLTSDRASPLANALQNHFLGAVPVKVAVSTDLDPFDDFILDDDGNLTVVSVIAVPALPDSIIEDAVLADDLGAASELERQKIIRWSNDLQDEVSMPVAKDRFELEVKRSSFDVESHVLHGDIFDDLDSLVRDTGQGEVAAKHHVVTYTAIEIASHQMMLEEHGPLAVTFDATSVEHHVKDITHNSVADRTPAIYPSRPMFVAFSWLAKKLMDPAKANESKKGSWS